MTLSPTTTFMLGAGLWTSGGWSLTGVTLMRNFSVTPLPGEARTGEEREAEEAEDWEDWEEKASEEGEVAEEATQARKAKLSLMVSESSWV